MSRFTVYTSEGVRVNLTQQFCDSTTSGRADVPTVIGVALSFAIIAVIAVLLRFLTVKMRKTWPDADDWVVLIALASIPSTVFCFIVVAAEFDQDRQIQYDLAGVSDPADRCDLAIAHYSSKGWPAQWSVAQGAASGTAIVGTAFFISATALVKAAILLLYRKIFTRKSMNRIVRWGLIFIVVFWLPFFIFNGIEIRTATTYDHSVKQSIIYCTTLIVLGVMDLATDLFLLALPAFYIWTLQMSLVKKLQCTGMFAIGIVCIIASIARLIWIVEYWRYISNVAALSGSPNASLASQIINPNVLVQVPMDYGLYIWRNCMIWTFIEPCASIVAACLPTYRPLIEAASTRVARWSRARKAENALAARAYIGGEERIRLEYVSMPSEEVV